MGFQFLLLSILFSILGETQVAIEAPQDNITIEPEPVLEYVPTTDYELKCIAGVACEGYIEVPPAPNFKRARELVLKKRCSAPGVSQLDLATDGQMIYMVGHGGDGKEYVYVLDKECNGIKKYPLSINIFGLTFDGEYFWASSSFEGTLYKLDKNFHEIERISLPYGTTEGLEYKDGYIWAVHNTEKDEISVTDVKNMKTWYSYTAPTNAPYALAIVDGALFVGVDFNVYQGTIDRGDFGQGLRVGNTGGYISGIVYDGQYLWVVDNDDDTIYIMEIIY